MAICHMATSAGSRAKGQSAGAKDDYLERDGKYAGKDGEKKNDVLISESGNMPEWANTPREYWEAADKYERANGRLFVQVEVALPVELSREQQIDLARDFAENLTKKENLPYTMAIHVNDENNPHCHIMMSERKNDGISRSPDTWFRKADAQNNPGARKTDALQGRDWPLKTREAWTGLANTALERAGRGERLDARTLEAQGIDREAQIHVGRNPEKKAENEAIKARNSRREEIKDTRSALDGELRELDAIEREVRAAMETAAAAVIEPPTSPDEFVPVPAQEAPAVEPARTPQPKRSLFGKIRDAIFSPSAQPPPEPETSPSVVTPEATIEPPKPAGNLSAEATRTPVDDGLPVETINPPATTHEAQYRASSRADAMRDAMMASMLETPDNAARERAQERAKELEAMRDRARESEKMRERARESETPREWAMERPKKSETPQERASRAKELADLALERARRAEAARDEAARDREKAARDREKAARDREKAEEARVKAEEARVKAEKKLAAEQQKATKPKDKGRGGGMSM